MSQERLDEVAEKLNGRPRKTLGFATPAARLAELIDGLNRTAERCARCGLRPSLDSARNQMGGCETSGVVQ